MKHENILKTKFYNQNETYEKSVFLMTKFPSITNPTADDHRLEQVITSVKNALKAQGYTARIARPPEPDYHPALWDKVEAFLFCCGSAVAIIENKVSSGFNSNVAMEWGWMRALDRPTLFLIEQSIPGRIADTGGLLEARFDWNVPDPAANGINAGIEQHCRNLQTHYS
jgi:hypothetical protein